MIFKKLEESEARAFHKPGRTAADLPVPRLVLVSTMVGDRSKNTMGVYLHGDAQNPEAFMTLCQIEFSGYDRDNATADALTEARSKLESMGILPKVMPYRY